MVFKKSWWDSTHNSSEIINIPLNKVLLVKMEGVQRNMDKMLAKEQASFESNPVNRYHTMIVYLKPATGTAVLQMPPPWLDVRLMTNVSIISCIFAFTHDSFFLFSLYFLVKQEIMVREQGCTCINFTYVCISLCKYFVYASSPWYSAVNASNQCWSLCDFSSGQPITLIAPQGKPAYSVCSLL